MFIYFNISFTMPFVYIFIINPHGTYTCIMVYFTSMYFYIVLILRQMPKTLSLKPRQTYI